MRSLAAPGSAKEQAGRIFLAAVLVVGLPWLPFGNYIAYPFAILVTWFHEMGHGLTAMLLGHDFERLVILSTGSGYAETLLDGSAGRIDRALIAAGGPLGPVMIGAALILASSRDRWLRATLYVLAGVILLSALIWIRSWVGLAVLPLIGAGLILLAQRGGLSLQRFGLQFLGVLAALSMLRDWDYLFSNSAVIGGQPMLSDTGAIAAELFLPHWFWAAAIIAVSSIIIGLSLRFALTAHRR